MIRRTPASHALPGTSGHSLPNAVRTTLPHLATDWQLNSQYRPGSALTRSPSSPSFKFFYLPVGGDSERFTTMHVTKTKRLVERDVNVPNYLIPDLHAYIDGERKECIAVGRRYWIKKRSDEPKRSS